MVAAIARYTAALPALALLCLLYIRKLESALTVDPEGYLRLDMTVVDSIALT